MTQITLAEEWTFRTPLRTITFPAGKHKVDDEVHEAALAAGAIKEKDKADGGRIAESGSQDAAGDAEG